MEEVEVEGAVEVEGCSLGLMGWRWRLRLRGCSLRLRGGGGGWWGLV